MKFNRKKNGYKIVVDNWDNKIKLFDGNNKKIKELEFSDHLKAVSIAKAL